MSFDDDFSKAYREFVDSESVPGDLQDRILASVKTSSKTQENSAPRKKNRSTFARRWMPFAVASTCAAVAIAIAVPVALSGIDEEVQTRTSGDGTTTGQSSNDFLGGSNLSIKAYAANGENPIIMPGEDNLVFFDPEKSAGGDTFWFDENGEKVNAYFTPTAFTIEGDGIDRIQMHVSKGELYGQTNEFINFKETPELTIGEDEIDDPRLRGKAKGYENCDARSDLWFKAPDDPEWSYSIQNLFRMKRIGKVVDAKKAEDSRVGTDQIQFGFLEFYDDDAAEGDVLSFSEIVDGDGRRLNKDATRYRSSNDGAILTVTVTFNDGKCETQVIELHDGVLACDDDGNLFEPARFFDSDKGDVCGKLVLYGTLIRATDEPFPYSDLPANEYAFELMPAVPDYIDPVPGDDDYPDSSD